MTPTTPLTALTVQRPRLGIYATLDGVEYPADSYPRDGQITLIAGQDPGTELFTWHAQANAWLATVPTSRCERLVEVTSLADHLGHVCQVIGIDPNGSVGLHYVGDEKAAVVRDGFVQVDAGTWAKTVSIFEVSGYRERHTDLLFDEWKVSQGGS